MDAKDIIKAALLNRVPVCFRGRMIGPDDIDKLRSSEGLTFDAAIEKLLVTGGRDAR